MSKSVKDARPLTAAARSFADPINDFVLRFEYWDVVFGVLSLIAPRQRHVDLSRWRSTASLDVSYLATPEACRRSVLVSRRPSTLFSREPQLSRWCGFRGKGRLNLPGQSSTKFARPLRCSLLLCCHLLRSDELCWDR